MEVNLLVKIVSEYVRGVLRRRTVSGCEFMAEERYFCILRSLGAKII